MEKRISVVIPTYRRPLLLLKCLQALAKQTAALDDFEIIIVTDGPDERTRTAVNQFSMPHPFIQFISLPYKQGPAAARNAGWKAANAPLIAFTDDDCQPAPKWLSSILNEYETTFPEYAAYTGSVKVPVSESPTDFELNTAHLENAEFITANCACTKMALQRTGGFDENFKLAWREDSELEFKLLLNNIPIKKINEALVVHPVRKAKWGISVDEQKKTMFNALLFKNYPDLFRNKIQQAPAWNYYFIFLGLLLTITGILIRAEYLFVAGTIMYLYFTVSFIVKRLSRTSRAPAHVAEMIATSLIIPFLSIYWTLYGAVKYRVLYF